jgi:solute carrier family 25 S-adenosylmethionine transporter 26
MAPDNSAFLPGEVDLPSHTAPVANLPPRIRGRKLLTSLVVLGLAAAALTGNLLPQNQLLHASAVRAEELAAAVQEQAAEQMREIAETADARVAAEDDEDARMLVSAVWQEIAQDTQHFAEAVKDRIPEFLRVHVDERAGLTHVHVNPPRFAEAMQDLKDAVEELASNPELVHWLRGHALRLLQDVMEDPEMRHLATEAAGQVLDQVREALGDELPENEADQPPALTGAAVSGWGKLLGLRGGGKVETPKTDWKSQMLFRERMIAGAGARGVAQTLLHPIDVARTRLQAKGVQMVFTPKTFVKGLLPQFALAFPAGASQFACYEWAKEQFGKLEMKGAFPEVVCGAFGALGASVIRVPQEVLKQRVQADIYPNAISGLQQIMKSEGVSGLYKGYFATISRDVPWNALSFMFFAQAKDTWKKVTGRAPNAEENLALGAAAGMTAAVIMTPVDVVKTRLMTGGAAGGIVGTFTGILEKEGPAVLMKGVVPRCMFLAPLAGLTLSFYESFAKQLVSLRTGVPAAELGSAN